MNNQKKLFSSLSFSTQSFFWGGLVVLIILMAALLIYVTSKNKNPQNTMVTDSSQKEELADKPSIPLSEKVGLTEATPNEKIARFFKTIDQPEEWAFTLSGDSTYNGKPFSSTVVFQSPLLFKLNLRNDEGKAFLIFDSNKLYISDNDIVWFSTETQDLDNPFDFSQLNNLNEKTAEELKEGQDFVYKGKQQCGDQMCEVFYIPSNSTQGDTYYIDANSYQLKQWEIDQSGIKGTFSIDNQNSTVVIPEASESLFGLAGARKAAQILSILY